MHLRMLGVISVLGIGLLGCNRDEFNPVITENPSLISYLSDKTIVQEKNDTVKVFLSLDKPSSADEEITLKAEGPAIYGIHYLTIPEQIDGKMKIDIQKGETSPAFEVISLMSTPSDSSSFSLGFYSHFENLAKGSIFTHEIKLPLQEQNEEENPNHEENPVINFGESFVHISENEATPYQFKLNISGNVNHSDKITIRVDSPYQVGYGTRFQTFPSAVQGEILLDVLPGASEISFNVIPMNDQKVLGNFDLLFTIEGSSQIEVGSQSQVKLRVEEDDVLSAEIHSISSLRSKFEEHSNEFWIGEDYYIEGVITSDTNVPNGKHAYIQDATGGILLSFIVDKKVSLGDHVKINLKGATGIKVNGQKAMIDITDLSGITVDKDVFVQPIEITLDQLKTGLYQGKKVRINNVSFVDAEHGLTFKGNRKIKTGTKEAVVSTSNFASFANESLPTGNISIVGIVGDWGFLMPQKLNFDIIY